MSNFLAPATVSAALQRLLTPKVSAAVGGAEVWVDRSDVKRQKAGVNIYLYKTSLDSVSRNDDLPGRTSDGSTLRARPRVPVFCPPPPHGAGGVPGPLGGGGPRAGPDQWRMITAARSPQGHPR